MLLLSLKFVYRSSVASPLRWYDLSSKLNLPFGFTYRKRTYLSHNLPLSLVLIITQRSTPRRGKDLPAHQIVNFAWLFYWASTCQAKTFIRVIKFIQLFSRLEDFSIWVAFEWVAFVICSATLEHFCWV